MRTYKADCPEIELKLKRGETKKMQIKTSADGYKALQYFFKKTPENRVKNFFKELKNNYSE